MRLFSHKIQHLRPMAAVMLALLTGACATDGTLVTRVRHANPELELALADLAHPKAPMRLGSAHNKPKHTLDGAMLNGLAMSDISTILGEPNRIRKDIPAQVWQYDLSHCYVDVFFYDENPQDPTMGYGPRVVYVQERPRQVKKVTPGLCLNKVWFDQRKRR